MAFINPATEIISALIGWFDTKEKAVLVAFVMLALFAAAMGWLGCRHFAYLRSVRSAATAIRRSLARTDFTSSDRLNALDSSFKNHKVVGQSWEQYRATLREDSNNSGSFFNLVDPISWFAPNRLSSGGYEKWISTWANVFLCLGLLFTFVGLSAALLGVVDSTGTAEKAQQAVNRILNVSSAKFITSIVGILLFIFWVLFGRWVSAGQHGATQGFAIEVQKLTILITPEVMLMDQLAAAREQTERMKHLADDVAVAFEARLNDVVGKRLDAFPAAIEESIRPLVGAIEGMGGTLSKGADDALGRVAERLEQAAETIRVAQGGIGSSGAEFGNQIGLAATTMTDSVARMAQAIESKLAGLESQIGHVNNALRQGAENITGVSKDLSEATSAALAQALTTISEQAAKSADTTRQQSEAALRNVSMALRLSSS